MVKINELYQWLHGQGVTLFERRLSFSNPATKATTIKLSADGAWGVFVDTYRIDTVAEENAIVLHECGHYATGATHEVSSPLDLVEKHEYKADKWAVTRALTADELNSAIADGYTDYWSLAELFNLPVDFIKMAVCWHTHGNLASELYF